MRDPIENVTRLQKQLNNLQLENQVLKNILDKAGLSYQNELASIRKTEKKEDFDPEQGKRIVHPKEITDRMAKLFFSFFWGRTDVYAKRNVNKNGEAAYYPQCDNFWSDNCHRKLNTHIDCKDCKYCSYTRLDLSTILTHLRGNSYVAKDVIGVYPLFSDGTCRFLVFDFDNHEKNAEKRDFANTDDTWIEEVEAMRDICTLNGIEPLVERSRSGKGAHIWIFFDKPISAAVVRKFGLALLDKGAEQVNLKSFNYYDRMLPAQDSLENVAIGMLVASLAAASVVKYQITMLQCEAGYYTACGKRIEIAEHMRYLPMGYFNQNSLGQITNITTNTMEQLADVATRVVMMTTGGVLTSSVITVMMLIFDIRIGFIAMVGMVLFFTVNSFLQRKSKALAPVKAAADEFVVEKVLEYVQGISEVRSYNLTGCASKELNEAIDKNRDINTTMELKTVPWMQLQSIILKLMGVAIILTSCGFYLAGSMTLQNCIGMIICSFLVFESLGSAGNYSTLLRIVDLSVSKVENVMRIKEMDTDGKNIIPKNFDIEVENVDFYYDENHAEDAKIINHLSVHIPERTTTAIVGPSGGGKTTLCHLISRFWDVSNGNISLGGENVRNYSVDSLMKNFSFVFQNVYLFEDTIANNIRFGQPEASMKLVMDAAKKACCHDFIMELPNGYDTVIGEGGTSLSGGEKQRISIARAIMKDAPVIILDEATANVDPENEKELMSAIEALTKEKTIIMIAHRLKTVEHADQILVLDKGQIVQQGRHSELLKQTGIYRKFILEREEAVGWKI